ncbi:MAG TPA: response regulator transcription factor [Clostridiaceae bacterium]|nr:response regulator transcription factor [Clostridiaceae bacterium]
MKKEVIKVLIADDHDIIRQGLKRIIDFEKDMDIVGEAENGEKVLDILKHTDPNVVVLLDLNMPEMNGIETLRKIKEQKNNTKVIMLTIENDRKTIYEAIHIGADGYILKGSMGTDIIEAVRIVQKGEKYIDKSLVTMFFQDIKGKNKRETCILDELSKREVEVLLYISRGFSNKEIGNELFISEKTVKNYATNVYRKISASDRVQATITAIENDIEDYYESKFK